MPEVKPLIIFIILSVTMLSCVKEEELPIIEFKNSIFTVSEGTEFTVILKSNKSIQSKDTIFVVRTGGDATYSTDFSTNPAIKRDTFKLSGQGTDSIVFQFSALLDNSIEESETATFEIIEPFKKSKLRVGENNLFTLEITDNTSIIEFELDEISVKERASIRIALTSNKTLNAVNNFIITKNSVATASASDYSVPGISNIPVSGNEPYFDLNATFDNIHENQEFVIFQFATVPLGFAIGPKSSIKVNIDNYKIGDNLVGEYLFNGSAADTNPGSKYNGTVQGATTDMDRSGNLNNAYNFDGVDDYISIPDNSSTDFNSVGDFSISLWVKPNESQSDVFHDILRKWAGDSQPYPFSISLCSSTHPTYPNQLFIANSDGSTCGNVSSAPSNTTIGYSTYQHFVFIKNGNKLIQYLNGVKVSETVNNLSCQTSNSTHITVGSRGQLVRFFAGKIDDLRFYNVAISQDLVSELFIETPIN